MLCIADDGRTPLHLVACEGQVEVTKHLIDKNVHLAPTNQWGNTPLEDAIRFKNKEIATLLVQAAAKHQNLKTQNTMPLRSQVEAPLNAPVYVD